MPSAHIVTRGQGAARRYLVRYRLGGRESRLIHAGSFRVKRLAEDRRNAILADLAAGRVPTATRLERGNLTDTMHRWLDSRNDLGASTRTKYRSLIPDIATGIGVRDIGEITAHVVSDYVTSLTQRGLGSTSIRLRMVILRSTLDYAGVTPNPARDAIVRAPRARRTEIKPPSRTDLEAMYRHLGPWAIDAIRALEDTGLRVSELAHAQPEDLHEGRLLIREGKTDLARRWVPVSPTTAALVTSGRAARLRPDSLRKAMRRACNKAGITVYSPHDIRHRHISLLVKQGVPLPEIKERVGHARASFTLDVYSHVILED